MSSLKMPFGKYKGKRLSKLPTDYLVWCRDKCDNLTDELRAAVEEELADRSDTPQEEAAEQAAPTEVSRPPKVSPLGQTLAGDVRMLFRNLALKYHPDRGGSHEAMRALNEFHDQLQELLMRTFAIP
ncbi:MAG: DUF3820 family protein [Planctomycetes bacterium]|nr:DUF3820 family protein [Planctomycetota bacterium]